MEKISFRIKTASKNLHEEGKFAPSFPSQNRVKIKTLVLQYISHTGM